MAVKFFRSKKSDTAITIKVQLKDQRDPSSWTVGTCVFSVRDQRTGTLIVDRAACNVLDAAKHEVEYVPVAGSDAVEILGNRICEFENTEPGGRVGTYPNVGGNALIWELVASVDGN